MKSKLLLIAIVLFSYSFANAQTSKDIEKKAKAETEKMVTALDLTDDQEVAIYRQNYMLVDHKLRFAKVEDKTEKMVTTMENIKAKYKESVEKILTDSQREQFKTWADKSKFLKD